MAIKSEVGLGLVESGESGFACSLTVEQTRANQLLVTAGDLVTGGASYTFPSKTFDFEDGVWTIQVGRWDGGEATIEFFPAAGFLPGNWEQLALLAGYGSGIEVVEGAIVGDVWVLKVV